MRVTLRAFGLFVAVAAALGCAKDKYGISPPVVEEYKLPTDEPRYTEPDKAGYRPRPVPKQEKTAIGSPGGGGIGAAGRGGF